MLKPLRIACAFLTRLPISTGELQPRQFGAAAACFPLVGLGIGAFGLGFVKLIEPALGPGLSAWLWLAAAALITGGLHLDGLADWFDAVGGGRGERARMLEILRDPRLGAHGACALVLLLAAKQSALAGMPVESLPLALLGAPALARALATWLLVVYPSARSEGLGATFASQVQARHVFWAGLCAGAVCAPFGAAAIAPCFFCSLAALLLGAWAHKRIGGINGDVCGAAIEVAELAFWVACRATAG